jgi:hypothetical protein
MSVNEKNLVVGFMAYLWGQKYFYYTVKSGGMKPAG